MKERLKFLFEKFQGLDRNTKKQIISFFLAFALFLFAVIVPTYGAGYKRQARKETKIKNQQTAESSEVWEETAPVDHQASHETSEVLVKETESTKEEKRYSTTVIVGNDVYQPGELVEGENDDAISIYSLEDYQALGAISTAEQLEEISDVEILNIGYEGADYTQVIVPVAKAYQWQTEENELYVVLNDKVSEQVEMYRDPSADSPRVGELFPGSGAFASELVEDENGAWYHLRSGEVEGYSRAIFFISGSEALEKANGQIEIFRNENTVDCMIVTYLNAVPVFDAHENVTEIKREIPEVSHITDAAVSAGNSEHQNYLDRISSQILAVTGQYSRGGTTSGAPAVVTREPNDYTYSKTWTSLADASAERQAVVNFALQYVGNPYVWGGNSLTKGVDCSGFMQQTYLNFGILLPRCSYEQVNSHTRIPLSDIRPGDLIFYAKNGAVYHVAMYIGDGKIVHARSAAYGIVIDYLTGNEFAAVSVLP